MREDDARTRRIAALADAVDQLTLAVRVSRVRDREIELALQHLEGASVWLDAARRKNTPNTGTKPPTVA